MHQLGTYPLTVLALGAICMGIFLLIKGGDWTIDGAVWAADKSGLSKIFIAATIVAFGTSAPELFTSINANLSGYPGVSMGNVVGSNIANVLMVLGIAALVAPIVIKPADVRVDTFVMIGATLAMAAGMIYGMFPLWAGLAMLASLAIYIIYQYKANKIDVDEVEESVEEGKFDSTKMALFALIGGIVTLVIGSELLVQGAIAGGLALGVPEAVIGMTVVAFGTSLPELTTCVAAARKQQSDMIIGGIIGSNIFNILSIVAITSIIKPLMVEERFLGFDLPAVLAVTFVLSAIMLTTGRIGRGIGIAFVMAYLAFIGFQYFGPGSTLMTDAVDSVIIQ